MNIPTEQEYRAAKNRQPTGDGWIEENPSAEVLADVERIRAYELAEHKRLKAEERS